MTRLGLKTVKREVETASGTTLVVSFTPAGVTTREKGRRTVYGPIPYGKLHLLGAQMKADEHYWRAAKKKLRRELRGGK